MRPSAAAALLAAALLAAAAFPPGAATAADVGQCTLRQAPSPASRRARHGKECTHLVHEYMGNHTADFGAAQDVKQLIFFLHVPRTAGKTYANCFLRTALPPSARCAKSYDVMRYNASLPACRALISHDDFSAADLLPPDAATITQLRRPVDRIVSAYEFAVDVAARGINSVGPAGKLGRRKSDWVGTLEVWPWSVLIPWFKQDMRERLARLKEEAQGDPAAWHSYQSPDNRTYWWNEARNSSVWVLPPPEPALDPYNNSLVMPLHEWVEHPIAEELLHTGATLQVLGLTNYSYWGQEETRALRGCLRSNAVAREMLLTLATKRLRRMAHVGLTERLEESVASMAADLGLNMSGPAYKYTSANAFSYDVGAEDDDALVTYNATTAGGVNVTVTRRQAMARANEVLDELAVLRAQVEGLQPQLDALVQREAKWLARQEDLRQLQAADATGMSEAAAQMQGEAGGGAYAPDALAPGAAAPGEGAVEPAAVDERGNVLDGNTEAYPYEGVVAEAAQGSAGSYSGPLPNGSYGTPAAEDSSGGDGAVNTFGSDDPPAEGDEIHSPWSEEIVALDEQISSKQALISQLEEELGSLHDAELVVLADQGLGRARQIIPDRHYLMPHGETLGSAYRRCAHAGHTKRERRKPYKHLRTPWGESFEFKAESRESIARATLDRIHRLNALDEELWKEGDRILTEKLAAQRVAGLLQDFPPPQYHHPSPHAEGRRRLRSRDAPPQAAEAPAQAPPLPSQQPLQQQPQPQQAATQPALDEQPVRDEL